MSFVRPLINHNDCFIFYLKCSSIIGLVLLCKHFQSTNSLINLLKKLIELRTNPNARTMATFQSKIKLLNVLIKLQNVMSVYHNFCTLNKRAKEMATLQVILSSLVYLASLIHYNIHIYARFYERDFMLFMYIFVYNLFSTALTLTSFIVSIRQSITFRIIITKINLVHDCYESEYEYSRDLRKLITTSIINMTLLFCSCLVMVIVIMISASDTFYTLNVHTAILLFVQTVLVMWREAQFYVELFIFNILINIITMALRQMNIMLLRITRNTDDLCLSQIKIDCDMLCESLCKIVPTFSCLTVCSFKLKQCFGIQVCIICNF